MGPPHVFLCVVFLFFYKHSLWLSCITKLNRIFCLTLCTDLDLVSIFPCGSPRWAESYFLCWGGSCRKCHSSFWVKHTTDQKSNQPANNTVSVAYSLPLRLHCAPLHFMGRFWVPVQLWYLHMRTLDNNVWEALGRNRKIARIRKFLWKKWHLCKNITP